MLRAQADRQAQMLRSEGEAQAISTVFNAIHAGQPDQALLAYQYMQMLPSIARGDANKVWIVPSELNKALEGLGSAVGSLTSGIPAQVKGEFSAPDKIDVQAEIRRQDEEESRATDKTMQEAIAAAKLAERPAVLRDTAPALEQPAVTAGTNGGTAPEQAPSMARPDDYPAYEPEGQARPPQ